MEVLYIEGVAIHGGPESCVGVREGIAEALAGGVWAGLSSFGVSWPEGAVVSVGARSAEGVGLRG